jgi:hypothetical protein
MWLSRSFLRTLATFIFDADVGYGAKVIIGKVAKSNEHALQFNLRLGWKVLAEVPDLWPGETVVIMTMRPEDCRWLEEKK